jgi:hypothetical protein
MRGVLLVVCLLAAGCTQHPAPAAAAPSTGLFVHGVVVSPAIVPVAGANVTLTPGDLSVKTDKGGLFSLGPLPPGSYKLTVRADGYADQSLQAAAGEGVVKIVLQAVRNDVPYIEVEHFDGYLECTFDTWVSPYQILGAPCVGIVDLVTGTNVSSDVWQFRWDVTAPGLKGILAEMVWDDQATGTQMGMLLRNVAGAGSGVDAGGTNVDTQYASTRGPAPLRMWVYQGQENPGADDGARFQDPQNQTMAYKLLILGRADYSKPADVNLMVQERPQVFLTKFYNAMGDPSYSVLNG